MNPITIWKFPESSGYPKIIQVMDDHDLVLKQPWWLEDLPWLLEKPPYLQRRVSAPADRGTENRKALLQPFEAILPVLPRAPQADMAGGQHEVTTRRGLKGQVSCLVKIYGEYNYTINYSYKVLKGIKGVYMESKPPRQGTQKCSSCLSVYPQQHKPKKRLELFQVKRSASR